MRGCGSTVIPHAISPIAETTHDNPTDFVINIDEIVINVHEIVINIDEIFLSINESFVDVRWVISNVIKELHDPASNFVVLGAPISPAGTRTRAPGQPSTGRTVTFEVIDILTFREGRIAEHRVILDQASLQRQLVP